MSMNEPKEILTITVPPKYSIKEWMIGDGVDTIFPELLTGCEELLYNDLDKVCCLILHQDRFEEDVNFVVRKDGVENTLNKLMEWCLENEHYLMCRRIDNLKKKVETKEIQSHG